MPRGRDEAAEEARRARERRAFVHELEEIGDNLPDNIQGVEGADVGTVTRHKRGAAHREPVDEEV